MAALAAVGLATPRIGFAQVKGGASNQNWVDTWGASPEVRVPLPGNSTNPSFTNQTVRMIVHTSIGGNRVRVRLSNIFGTDSLAIGAAHVALRDGSGKPGAAIVKGTDRALTFGGAAATTVPPGAAVVSDAVSLRVPAASDLAVTIYLPGPTGEVTLHAAAHDTNYVSTPGNFVGTAELPVDRAVTSWFYLMDVEVAAPKGTLAVIALGDSITDGTNSALDANHRWPNFLAERLLKSHDNLAVVDEGIGGNRLLHGSIGPSALSRLDRDALSQAGAGYLIVQLGINDIGFSEEMLPTQSVSAAEMIAGLREMISHTRKKGLKVFGCTLTPFEGAAYFSEDGEAKREAVNAFIRTSGAYDGVIDFDAAVRDPAQPRRILPARDSGDHLHPNDAGYRAMANAVNLSLFR